jgi:uncharacterized protein (TIRG00374 family)
MPAYIRFALKGFCTVSLLWLVVWQLDTKAAVDQILDIGGYQLVGALIVLFSLSLPGAVRWSNVLKIVGYPLQFVKTWHIMLVASFFNQALPSTMGGDIVRMVHGYRVGIPINIAISNVVIDRLTSFVSLLLLVAMTLPIIFFIISDTSQWWVAPFFIATGVMGLYLLVSLKHIPSQLQTSWLVRTTINFSEHLSAVLLNRRWGWKAMVAGLAVHIMRVASIWIIAMGLNINTGLLDCFALVPLALVVAMIPISIGGWGLREGAFLGAFSLVGVMPGEAVALSVTFGLSSIFASLPGGLIWLLNSGIRRSVNAELVFRKRRGLLRNQICVDDSEIALEDEDYK